MQSGKIKHWNQDKGYGFIDVDDQNEDVFFHVSKVRLSQPITVGQSVYFNSVRNDKNQLRATEVTSSSLSIEPDTDNDTASSVPKHRPNNAKRNSQHSSRNSNRSSQSGNQNKRSLGSTLFSLIAIIAVAFYFFGDLKSTFFADGVESTTISASKSSSPATNSGITGDAQIDRTVALIQQGGPFPYPNKDGTTFYNREGRLPAQSQGYYREYTVPTPNVSHRGARRIVTGGYPPTVYYLTVDHYDSFRKLEVN
ncbi:ribonuclease domain-containing protein [Psychrobacter sp. PAMC 21119]|uniref:ribonuclease domain-containing protein n=1 Tax=Psychrobacter sp. PAMC 21119 TaxID=1112209 RepID=UPI0002893264|nr:ribonuclease domain-containing protein [Psychrobacter sp. PAMC 21119]